MKSAGSARPALTRTVAFEQAVYGSFPFRDGGYGWLAKSPGCRDEWLAGFRDACQKLGEKPSGVADAPGLFALRLPDGGPWLIAGFSPQGSDDRGRPGALAFHGLFLTPRAYRRAGCNPFAMAGALRSAWSESTTSLPSGVWTTEPSFGWLGRSLRRPGAEASDPGAPKTPPQPPGNNSQGPSIALALQRGRRLALEAPGPIDALARSVWDALPLHVRARKSVATWVFGNGNRFDLLAVPRLSGIALDSSYMSEHDLSWPEPSLTRPERALRAIGSCLSWLGRLPGR